MRELSLRHRADKVFILLSLLVLFFILFAAPLPLQAQVVISQVYGGGGNSGAKWKNDFIELFNAGTSSVNLSGWTVQYASTTGTSWQKTPLSGSLAPGQYYLVQEAVGSGGTDPLPTPDAVGTISMGAGSAKVALVASSALLAGACPSGMADLVVYGTPNPACPSSPAPALSNTTAALRLALGCALTGINSADFAADTPAPRNSSALPTLCFTGNASPSALALNGSTLLTVGVPPAMTVSSIAADLAPIAGADSQPLFDDGTHGDEHVVDGIYSASVQVGQCSPAGTRIVPVNIVFAGGTHGAAAIRVDVTAPTVVPLSIPQIQGSGSRSPYECLPVTTSGVVTFVKKDGFFLQDPTGDGDPTTSDGVYIYTKSAPPAAAAVGNSVTVSGKVQEYVPSGDPNSPPVTEITGTTVSLPSGVAPLPDPINIGSLDPNGALEPLERYEGMRVHVNALTVTGPTLGTVNEANATGASNGLFFGVLAGTPRPFREAGIEAPDPIPNPPCCIPRFDGNPERLRVDTSALPSSIGTLEVTSGAVVSNITGPLDYGYRTYSIVAEEGITFAGNIAAVPLPAPNAGEFTVATMNLQRFFDTKNAGFANRLNKVSLAIRDVLRMPDIIGVEEVDNLSTLQTLADKVNSDAVASSPAYRAYPVPFVSGHDPSGINVGFLVKPGISIHSVTQYGGNISLTPGGDDFLNDRPPLVLDASVSNQGETERFYVVVNHLRSLSGVEIPGGLAQEKRKGQAEFLANLIQHDLGNGKIVSIGDYNAYELNDGYVDVMGTIVGNPAPADQVALASPDLVDPNLTDLLTLLDPPQRYSYVYDGTAQALDHVLVSSSMVGDVTRFFYAHNNADFPESYRSDFGRPERYADHDIAVAYFRLPTDHTPPTVTVTGVTEGATYPLGAVPQAGCTTTDSWSAIAVAAAVAITGGTENGVGHFTATCSGGKDAAGNLAPPVSVGYNVVYSFSGFLPPLDTPRPFKSGSTVPVKWTLTDVSGVPTTALSAIRSIQVAGGACGGGAMAEALDLGSSGNTELRYAGSQFLFNWQTGPAGCYQLVLTLDDNTVHSIALTLK